jgi:hypothetical protein
MRIYKVWDMVFLNRSPVIKWIVIRNNWVKAGTYTVWYKTDNKDYAEIIEGSKLFWTIEEIDAKIIEEYECSIKQREYRIKDYKERIENYNKFIIETIEKISLLKIKKYDE